MWPFKKKKRVISRDRFLQSVPIKNPGLSWEEENDGTITLKIPRSKKGLLRLLSGPADLPDYRQVKLDEIGSKVWKKIDGKADMKDFMEWMNQEFKMNSREAELSLALFMEKLSDKTYIVLLVPPPKPGTPEAKEEAAELRKRLKELEKDFKDQKLNQDQYNSFKKEIEKRLEAMGEQTGGASN